MRKSPRIVILVAMAVILTIPWIAHAQGLGQTFDWPEIGFTMNYPDGWVESAMDEQTRFLSSDPNFDPSGSADPTSPAIVILGFPAEFAEMMGSPAEVLNTFASEFGATGEAQELVIAGHDALRIGGQIPDEAFLADVVLITGDSFLYILVGVAPEGQNFEAEFTNMLNTIAISEPVAPPPGGGMGGGMTGGSDVLVTGVRITMDQTIVGYWNEIDAVELVGADADGFEVSQWAVDASATSSYGEDSWSPAQATGEPDTPDCSDAVTAWASETSTGYDSLTLTYGLPVVASEVNIHQNLTPGAIVMVELLPADPAAAPIAIFTGVDPTTACPGIFSIPVAAAGAPMGESQTFSGQITDKDYYEDWAFDGTTGDVVTITMNADPNSSLDTYLYLYDANGNELTSNDDAEASVGGLFDSQIANFTLPADGTYTIRATRFGEESGSGTGAYDLTLTIGGGSGNVSASGGEIAFGQAVTGVINDSSYQQDWTFSGMAGDTVTITMVDASGGLDPYLYLYDANGLTIAENDDANDSTLGFNSQIVNISLPANGTYTIRATRFAEASGSSTGSYELTLEYGQASVPVGSLQYGGTVSGEISDSQYFQDWTFEANQGDQVTVTMIDTSAADSLDPYLYIIGPNGAVLIENDDADDSSVGFLNSQIASFYIAESGTYTIRATRFADDFGSSSGTYDLSLSQGK